MLRGNGLPQKNVFQDNFAIAGGQWCTTNAARDIAFARFRSGFGSDNLIERGATGALEKRFSYRFCHDVPQTRANTIHFGRVGQRQFLCAAFLTWIKAPTLGPADDGLEPALQ